MAEYVNRKYRRHRCAELYTVRGWSFGKINRATHAAMSQLQAWKTQYGWVQATVAPRRGCYTLARQAEVLAALTEIGSLTATARQTSISKRTIGRWRDAATAAPAPAPIEWRCYRCNPAFGVRCRGRACHLCGQLFASHHPTGA